MQAAQSAHEAHAHERSLHKHSSGRLSGHLDVADARLASAPVNFRVERHLIAFGQRTQTGPLQRGGVDKNVAGAIRRLNEAKTPGHVIKLHDTVLHQTTFD